MTRNGINLSANDFNTNCNIYVPSNRLHTLRNSGMKEYFKQPYIGMYYICVKYLCIKEFRESGLKWFEIEQNTGIPKHTCRKIYSRYKNYPIIVSEEWKQWVKDGLYPVTFKTSTNTTIYRLMKEIPPKQKYAYRYEAV